MSLRWTPTIPPHPTSTCNMSCTRNTCISPNNKLESTNCSWSQTPTDLYSPSPPPIKSTFPETSRRPWTVLVTTKIYRAAWFKTLAWFRGLVLRKSPARESGIPLLSLLTALLMLFNRSFKKLKEIARRKPSPRCSHSSRSTRTTLLKCTKLKKSTFCSYSREKLQRKNQ